MAITIVGVSPSGLFLPGGVSGVDVTPALPAGVLAGDLLLLPALARLAAMTIDLATPSYALASPGPGDDTTTNLTAEIQSKVAGGSEGNPTVHTSVTNTQPSAAIVVALRGAAGLTIPAPNIATSGSSVVAPAATPVSDNSMVLRVYVIADDNTITTPPPGHNTPPLFFEAVAQGSGAAMAVFEQTALATIAGGVAAATCVFSGSDPYLAYTVVIAPAAGGTDVADVADTTGPIGLLSSVLRSVSNGVGVADTTGPVGPATGPARSQANATARVMSVAGWAGPTPSRSVSAGVSTADTIGSVGVAPSPARSDFGTQDRAMGGGYIGVFGSPARSTSVATTRAIGESSLGPSVGLAVSEEVEPSEPRLPDVTVSPWGPVVAVVPWDAMTTVTASLGRVTVEVTM
jgi:hypothetical protein